MISVLHGTNPKPLQIRQRLRRLIAAHLTKCICKASKKLKSRIVIILLHDVHVAGFHHNVILLDAGIESGSIRKEPPPALHPSDKPDRN